MKLNPNMAFVALLSITLLTSCGSGGGSDAAPQANENTQTLEIAPESEFGLISPPDAMSATPIDTSADESENNVSDFQAFGSIANLFGNMQLSFSFFDSDESFILDVNWGAESLALFDDDSLLLIGSGTIFRVEEDGVVTAAGSREVLCQAANDEYFCTIIFSFDSIVLMLFTLEFDTSTTIFSLARRGVMEFCQTDTEADPDVCLNELFFSPDGPATVLVSELRSAAAISNAANATYFDEFDVENRLLYLEQGSASSGSMGSE